MGSPGANSALTGAVPADPAPAGRSSRVIGVSGPSITALTRRERLTLDVPERRLYRSQRILGWELVVAPLLVLVLLPASPADQSSIGDAGWPVLLTVALVQAATGVALLVRTRLVDADRQLGANLLLAAGIAVFVWLTGGAGSPYSALFPLVAGSVGPQGLRRVLTLAAGVMALACLPVAYDAHSANDTVRLVLTGLVSALFMAFVTWVAREIREEEIDVRAEAKDARDVAEELRRLDESRDRFISTAAHELRSPLSVILMHSEELLEGEAGELSGEQREIVAGTRRSAQRLEQVVDELLELAQMDAGAVTLRRTRFPLGDSLEIVSREYEAPAAQRGVTIQTRIEPGLAVDADQARLELVLANLLSNAVKYSQEGGTVRIGATRSGEKVVVEIADDGVGIPDEELGQVGERFFRASSALGTKGTGLGLAIAREIVELHSGTLEITSRSGLGTTVVLTVPALGEARDGAPRSGRDIPAEAGPA